MSSNGRLLCQMFLPMARPVQPDFIACFASVRRTDSFVFEPPAITTFALPAALTAHARSLWSLPFQ